MSSKRVVSVPLEMSEALRLLRLARRLLEETGELTAIMFLDHAIAALAPGGSPLTVRPLR